MARKIVSVSMDQELHQWLKEFAAAMNFNESQAVRYMLRRAKDTPELRAVLIEEVNGVQYRMRKNLGLIREGFIATLVQLADDLLPEHLLTEDSREEREQVESLRMPPALPARSEDIVEGEIVTEGLGGRRRRTRRR